MKSALLVLPSLLAIALQAQTYEQVAPQSPVESDPKAASPALPAPAEPSASSEDAQVILPALRGLIFVAEASAVSPAGLVRDGIDLSAVPRLAEDAAFRQKLEARLGQPLTLGGLREITREAVLALRAADRPVVDVAAPEQSLATGTIQLLVTEGRRGRVLAEGNRWFSAEQLVSEIRATPGGPIASSELLADLDWLNQNPFRRVDVVFARGAQPGETDIILRTQDRRPWRLYAGFDDSGTPVTDEERWFVGVNGGDLFGLGHQANYQFTSSPDVEKMLAHSGSYVVPLRWRHTLTLFGSHATSKPDIPFFSLEGRSWQAGLRYRVPLRAWRGVEQALTAGFDFKRSDNNLAFGGTSIFAQATDVVQLIVNYAASRSDAHGLTALSFTAALSPGGIGARNSNSDYEAARSFAKADYTYARLSLERTTRLPAELIWTARAEAQLASGNLLGSEQLGFGGSSSLRGYDEREANGDNGVILVNELRGPSWSVGRHLGATKKADALVPLVFVDAGVAVLSRLLPGEERARELLSIGAGLRYSLGSNLLARADYGWQLRDSGISPTGHNHRGHVSVTVAW